MPDGGVVVRGRNNSAASAGDNVNDTRHEITVAEEIVNANWR